MWWWWLRLVRKGIGEWTRFPAPPTGPRQPYCPCSSGDTDVHRRQEQGFPAQKMCAMKEIGVGHS